LFEDMHQGLIDGFVCLGQNPVVGGPNARIEREALAKLRWMVVVDHWEHETAAFWKSENGANPADIDTEVFFLPRPPTTVCERCATRTNSYQFPEQLRPCGPLRTREGAPSTVGVPSPFFWGPTKAKSPRPVLNQKVMGKTSPWLEPEEGDAMQEGTKTKWEGRWDQLKGKVGSRRPKRWAGMSYGARGGWRAWGSPQ
jgi:hypothetical protein